MSTVTKTGRVKVLRESFAFLTSDSGEDCFVHASVWQQAGLALQKGDAVRYEVEPSARGLRAVSIELAD